MIERQMVKDASDTDNLPSMKVTPMWNKISQLNAQRNVSDDESELNIDTTIIVEKQRSIDKVEIIDGDEHSQIDTSKCGHHPRICHWLDV